MLNKVVFSVLNRTVLMVLPAWLALCGSATAATLFFDDFNGSSLDQSVWRLPTGPGTFYGRTQIKPFRLVSGLIHRGQKDDRYIACVGI